MAARRTGAHVFNAHAIGGLTAADLARLGFRQGDGYTYLHLEAPGVQSRGIEAEDACWHALM